MMSSYLEDNIVQKLDAVQLTNSPAVLPDIFLPSKEALFEEQDSLLAMVKRLRWKYITLIVDYQEAEVISKSFNEAAEKEDVCVVNNIFVNTNK